MADNKPPAAGRGRPKGSPNKVGAAIKDMIAQALDEAHEDGGVGYLKDQASKNPAAFLGLVGKILPKDIDATVNGDLSPEMKRWLGIG